MTKLKAFKPLAPGSEVMLSEYVERWLASLQSQVDAGDITARSVDWKRHALGRVTASLGRRRLDQLTAADVEWALGEMAEQGLARATIKHTRGQLALALDRALAIGLVNRNAARLAQMPAGIKPSKQKREAMTVDQARALLAAAEGERLGALFVTALMLGLRPGELLGLRWADVDFDAGTITVSHALHRDGDVRRDQDPGVEGHARRSAPGARCAAGAQGPPGG